ncbi:MAG: rhomboid family intramembrane serine protease [Bacteroidia bacterium]|nr:rhomboid family intramembrane serine protease [Bacteroidia bacterium]
MSITLVVLGVCAAASLWAWGQGQQLQWTRWGLVPYRIRLHGEWYRFLTSIFFHADVTHLLVNSIVFYSFGSVMERYYGPLMYSLLLGAGTVGSGLLTYLRYHHNPHHVSIGLSGVVNAVLFAFILHNPKATLLIFFFLPLPAWLFALLYLLYSLYEARRGQGIVNHWAHLGGAAAGLVFAYLQP